MIQVLADGALVYDSRLSSYGLIGLTVTTGKNKGGTASITMPPGHPAYDSFVSYRTIVEIYRDNVPVFRGRAFYPSDDFHNRRTVVCEGEMCFFGDAVSRPYLYQDSPAAVFASVLAVYNSQVESWKQFKLGTVTVVDDNDYIRMESSFPETVLETLNKLVSRCGGSIVFTTNSAGERVVNWYETTGYRSSQVIEFGSNILNFARNGSNTNLITAVLPYGAMDDEGNRVTIESVNNGQDYIVDEEARAIRGFIMRPMTWDDVTQPSNLLRKAQQYLEQNRYIITSLELTALDLSYLDKTIDSFRVGDTIRVRSKPHKVDDDFILTEKTENLLDVASSTISLGKEITTLTNADVAGDVKSLSDLHKTTQVIRADYTLGIAASVQATESRLTSLIEQTSESIKLEVSKEFITGDQLTESISTTMQQFSDQFLFEFNSLKETVDANDAEGREQFAEIYKYISFKDGDIILGAGDSAITLVIEHDRISFRKSGVELGYWNGTDFHTGNIVVEVNERAQFGNFAFIPRSNGSLSFLKVK